VVELLKSSSPLPQKPDDYVYTDEQGKPIDQAVFGRAFQGVLRVLRIRPRPFYNTRHAYISVALTVGCKTKWIAKQCGTSVAMIEENYGKYIRDDGDITLRAYVEKAITDQHQEQTETSDESFSNECKYAETLVVPVGLEPALPT
jgi:integrase